ncbi:MAG: hypothetical protein ABSF12_15715, partial [Bryobacteraceae bacterium]
QPALVGFFGWGPGIGVGFGFGFGNVGWVALAPYERFYPGYGAGIYGRGFGAMNVPHTVAATALYRNARVSNGVTSMASNQFGRAGVTTGNYVHATSADLAHAGSVRGSVPIAPSRESTHFSNTSAGATHASDNSHFYSSHASSASASHISFDQQRQAMARSASTSTPATHSVNTANTGGWQHVNPTTSTNSVSTPKSTAPAASSWQKFEGNKTGSTGSTTANGSLSSGAGKSSSVRINPSVVQSRGAATRSSSSGSSSSRSGGGGRR